MSPRILVLGVAILAGGVAAFLMLTMEPEKEVRVVEKQAPVIPTEMVLVAKMDIPIGTALTDVGLTWQTWPKDNIAPAYVLQSSRPNAISELRGSVARSKIFAGDPIRPNKLAQPGTGFLAAVLPAGKRAIAVSISTKTTAGGFVLPNDRVDIIHSIQEREASGAVRDRSNVLLENVRVLAIGQTIEEVDGQKVVGGATATLELTPRQSEVVISAERTGALSLALRSISDSDVTGDDFDGEDVRRKGYIQFVTSGKSRYVPTR